MFHDFTDIGNPSPHETTLSIALTLQLKYYHPIIRIFCEWEDSIPNFHSWFLLFYWIKILFELIDDGYSETSETEISRKICEFFLASNNSWTNFYLFTHCVSNASVWCHFIDWLAHIIDYEYEFYWKFWLKAMFCLPFLIWLIDCVDGWSKILMNMNWKLMKSWIFDLFIAAIVIF